MKNSKKEKKTVIFITVILCIILFLYSIIWLIGSFVFLPLIIGLIIVLISGLCIIKCTKERLKEIEEEKDVISKY